MFILYFATIYVHKYDTIFQMMVFYCENYFYLKNKKKKPTQLNQFLLCVFDQVKLDRESLTVAHNRPDTEIQCFCFQSKQVNDAVKNVLPLKGVGVNIVLMLQRQ